MLTKINQKMAKQKNNLVFNAQDQRSIYFLVQAIKH